MILGGLLVKKVTKENMRYPKKITTNERDPSTDRFVETSSVLGTGKNANMSIECKNLLLTFWPLDS